MFEILFHYPRVLARHVNGPLAEERRRYRDHRAAQGTPRSTLLRYAMELLVVASNLVLKPNAFLRHLGARGLSRASLATAAKSLRRLFHYAYEQGWCRRDVAEAILAPRLFRQEDVPQGPAWADVRRLLASTHTGQPGDVRNR
jgi:site-specific recombinase XerC